MNRCVDSLNCLSRYIDYRVTSKDRFFDLLKLSYQIKVLGVDMSIENRVKATIKNVEGKLQEVVGEVTGNPDDKIEGQAKQSESKVLHVVENAKDEIKRVID
jgi:uncharacterized protein YjbJ (UPF0337 family)